MNTTPTSTLPPAVSGRRAATRDRLMTAAVAVFAERGIIGASVEEICEAAGFTRGAFYSNFADKDELVLAMLRHQMESQYAAARLAIDAVSRIGSSDPEHAVATALEVFQTNGRPDREWILTQHELLLYAARRPGIRDTYRAFADSYLEQFGALIAQGVQAAGLELALPFDDALALLTSCHLQDQLDDLFVQDAGTNRLRLLLRLITRPAA